MRLRLRGSGLFVVELDEKLGGRQELRESALLDERRLLVEREIEQTGRVRDAHERAESPLMRTRVLESQHFHADKYGRTRTNTTTIAALRLVVFNALLDFAQNRVHTPQTLHSTTATMSPLMMALVLVATHHEYIVVARRFDLEKV